MSCPMSGMNNAEDNKSDIPNYREAECCQYCIHGHDDVRCGCNVGYVCSKYKEEVSETGVCDKWEGMI